MNWNMTTNIIKFTKTFVNSPILSVNSPPEEILTKTSCGARKLEKL